MACLRKVQSALFQPVLLAFHEAAYVVDTGKPNLVATVKKQEDDTRAHVMPNMSTAGSSTNLSTLMILLRMVSATRALFPISIECLHGPGMSLSAYPTKTAPANSQTAAIHMACLRVKERDDTEVAKELATSLAPILKASKKAKIMPRAKM